MSPSHHIFFLTNQNLDLTKGIKNQQVNVTVLKCVFMIDLSNICFVYLLDTDIDLLDFTKLTKQFNVYLCRDLTHIAVRYHDYKLGDRK